MSSGFSRSLLFQRQTLSITPNVPYVKGHFRLPRAIQFSLASAAGSNYRIFIKDLRFSRLLLCALAIASHLSFARNDRLRVLFVIASEAKQSLSKPQLFSEVSIDLWSFRSRAIHHSPFTSNKPKPQLFSEVSIESLSMVLP